MRVTREPHQTCVQGMPPDSTPLHSAAENPSFNLRVPSRERDLNVPAIVLGSEFCGFETALLPEPLHFHSLCSTQFEAAEMPQAWHLIQLDASEADMERAMERSKGRHQRYQ